MIGYLSIFLAGIDIGNLILPASPPALFNIQSPRTRTFVWLIISSVVSIAALQLTGISTKIQVSRRFVIPSPLTSTNEGKSSVRTLDCIVQHDLPSWISRRSNDILPESKY